MSFQTEAQISRNHSRVLTVATEGARLERSRGQGRFGVFSLFLEMMASRPASRAERGWSALHQRPEGDRDKTQPYPTQGRPDSLYRDVSGEPVDRASFLELTEISEVR